MEPQDTNANSGNPMPLKDAHPLKLVYLGLFVFVIIAGAAGYVAYTRITPDGLTAEQIVALAPRELINSMQAGDFSAAMAERESLLSDPNITPDKKALVTLGSVSLDFRVSGDVNDILGSIQNLKKVALDPDVTLWTRVLAMNRLAFAYCASGRDPLAFAELYKDAPFNSYLVPGDPDASARNLAEWSYSLRPSAFAAARIARWYAQQYANDSDISAQQREEYGEIARKYVALAEQHEATEASYDPEGYAKDGMYAEYLFWLSRDIAWLATRGDQAYISRYKQVFEDSLAKMLATKNTTSVDTIMFTRQYYARYALKIENDNVTAKKQLELLAADLRALQNPLTSSFVRVVRNEKKNHPNKDTWRGIEAMTKLSPAYKAEIDRVLAIPDTQKTSYVDEATAQLP